MGTLIVSSVVGMFRKPPLFADTLANFADAAMTFPSCVAGCEGMAPGAVGAAGLHPSTSTIVLGGGNGLKMVGVDAGPVAAKVVNGQAFRDRPFEQFIGYPVGWIDFPFDSELAMTMRYEAASPNPASRRLLNFGQEAFPHGALEPTHPSSFTAPPLPLIVHEAETFCHHLSVAQVYGTAHGAPPYGEYNTDCAPIQEVK